MANKKKWLGILVMLLVFGMTFVGCGGGSVKVEDLASKLAKMKANTAETPYTIKLDATVNILAEEKMKAVNAAVRSEGKYVILDLSECTVAGNIIDYENTIVITAEFITRVILPKTLKTIGLSAFERNMNLTSVEIPSGVTSIEGSAFYLSGLTSVTIPSTVAEIGEGAFGGNVSYLTSVTFAEGSSITADNFGEVAFPPYFVKLPSGTCGSDKLKEAYLAGGAGTYILNDLEWTKQ